MKGNILIVDDHPGISLLLSEVFTYASYHVTNAKTGKEALEKIKSNLFDIIFLDQHLPLINGTEILKRLDEQGFSTPIVLMSGMCENIEEQVKQYSFVKKIISKPFNLSQLQSFVDKTLSV